MKTTSIRKKSNIERKPKSKNKNYHLMPKTELEDFHLLDAEEQIPLGPYCKYRRIYVTWRAKNHKLTAIIYRKCFIPHLSASAPRICSRGIHPSTFIKSNQCPMISNEI